MTTHSMNDPECCCCAVETVVEFDELDDADDPASTSASHGDGDGDGDGHDDGHDDDPDPDPAPLARWITDAVHRVLLAADIHRGHLSIAIVGDPQMIDLHQRYLNDPTTTDVLTFDLRDSDHDDPADDCDDHDHDDVDGTDDGAGADVDVDVDVEIGDATRDAPGSSDEHSIFGEIIACFDEAKRQTVARDHDVRMELLLYIVHGLLHLLGFDDHDPEEAARMHQREDEWLIQAGFSPVYRTDPQP